MKLSGLVALLAAAARVCAQDVSTSPSSGALTIADIPSCGLICLTEKIGASGCDLTDLSCVCTNNGLAHSLAACMLANCTMAEASQTSRVQASLCNLPHPDEGRKVLVYIVVTYFFSILFIAARTAGKILSKRFGADDWWAIASCAMAAFPFACMMGMVNDGFGQHSWDIKDGKLLPILRYFQMAWTSYVIVMGAMKAALLLFYLQIFRSTRLIAAAWVLMAQIVISTLVVFFISIFACRPINSFYDRDIKGKCVNIQALAYANCGNAVLSDIGLLLLPTLFLRKLQMPRAKKFAVGLMFAVGSFGTIVSILRLRTFVEFKVSIDPTWDYVPVTIWTGLELMAGYICISLPSVRTLLVHVLPDSFKERFNFATHSKRRPSIKQSVRKFRKPQTWTDVSTFVEDESMIKTEKKGTQFDNSSTTNLTKAPANASFDQGDRIELKELATPSPSLPASSPALSTPSPLAPEVQPPLPPPPPPAKRKWLFTHESSRLEMFTQPSVAESIAPDEHGRFDGPRRADDQV